MRGLLFGILIAGCMARGAAGPRLTGTCDGACAHYVECKAGHLQADRMRCTAECPQVFADPDSLMGYESLRCEDAVEFVDGAHPPATKTTQR